MAVVMVRSCFGFCEHRPPHGLATSRGLSRWQPTIGIYDGLHMSIMHPLWHFLEYSTACLFPERLGMACDTPILVLIVCPIAINYVLYQFICLFFTALSLPSFGDQFLGQMVLSNSVVGTLSSIHSTSLVGHTPECH